MQNQEILPFTFVIFGATGDLTKRKLIPSLYRLYLAGLLPDVFQIIAFARRSHDVESYSETLFPFVNNASRWREFVSHFSYIHGDFRSQDAYDHLRREIERFEQSYHLCPLRLFYLAVSPDDIPVIVEHLAHASLHLGCGEGNAWSRIVIEKPFGFDLESARTLNSMILQFFSEEQIYRIDHYLGKETVQNILSVRFANIIMEPVWNRDFIHSIEINAFESVGVGERGAYYDKVGALRDMVQSHLLQILALTLMEQPLRFDAEEIRSKKCAILQALRRYTPFTIARDTVRGQYVAPADSLLNSYRKEPNVASDSTTETFVALRTYVDLDAWRDVPLILRTGKRLSEYRGEIIVHFKRSGGTVFSNLFCELRSNILKIRLQPDPGVQLQMLFKQPGFHMRLCDVYLDYAYRETYDSLPDAYERLLMDALLGDQSLFMSTQEIDLSWQYVTHILQLWHSDHVPLYEYFIGSDGPALPV